MLPNRRFVEDSPVIWIQKITRIEPFLDGSVLIFIGNGQAHTLDASSTVDLYAKPGDYLMKHEDGSFSWISSSPGGPGDFDGDDLGPMTPAPVLELA